MEPNVTWSWLWQNFISDALFWVFVAVLGTVITVLRKKRSEWLSPVLYGLIGMSLFAVILYSDRIYAKWPEAAPLILAATLLGAAGLHLAAVFAERKFGQPETVKTEPEKPDHSKCEQTINQQIGQIERSEKHRIAAELQFNGSQTRLEEKAKDLWKEQQESETLRAEISALQTKLDVFSVPSGQMQLTEALYFAPGHDSEGLDVLKILQSDIDNRGDGKLWLGIDELYQQHFRPDPKLHTPKVLRIGYLHRGKPFSVTVPEDIRMVLPLSYKMIERDASGNLVVRY